MLSATGDTMSDFAGHVSMAQVATKIAFKRLVEATHNPWTKAAADAGEAPAADLEESTNERLSLFLRANESSAKLMAQRLELQDKYKLVEKAPQPMAIRLNVIHVAKAEAERRLALARPDKNPVPVTEPNVKGEMVES